MAYCTEKDLVERFGEAEISRLKKRVNDPNVVQAACDDATNTINSYIAVRYVTPLNPRPILIVSAATDIARYKLWNTDTNEEVRERYESAIYWLKDIAKGLASLIKDDGSLYPEQNAFAQPIIGASRERIFTNSLFEMWPGDFYIGKKNPNGTGNGGYGS